MSNHQNSNVFSGKSVDITLAIVFAALTIAFILLMGFHRQFSELAWARHHNLLSWYIRPLLLLPFCYFAFRRSFAGMLFTIFAIATSMMWFPEPTAPSEDAKAFLAMEIEYLSVDWTPLKLLVTCSIPLFFVLLAAAFWKRKPMYGFLVLVIGGIAKMTWSVAEGSTSGYLLFPAAILGLIVSGAVIAVGQRKQWL